MSELSAPSHGDGRPFGMPRKAYALLLDRGRFRDWELENEGPDGLLTFVCAQVASGVSLKTLSEHYVVDYGLLWAWLCEDSERIERYELAQRGVAEYYVSETPEIADNGNDVPRDKLRIDTRLKVAARWNRARYGEVAATNISIGANSLVAILSGLPSAQVEAERAERLVEGESLDSAAAVEKIPEKVGEVSDEPEFL